MSEVTLEVDGKKLSGWKTVSIERELGAICGRFSVSLLDSWEKLSKSWFIKPFSKCTVYIDDERVLTGYVDAVNMAHSSNGTEISVSGRDLTSDLVDCTPGLKVFQYNNISYSTLARKLLANFSIEFVRDYDPKKAFKFVQINPGTRVSSILEEYARYRGLILRTDQFGRLVATNPGSGSSQVSLVYGQNIKAYTLSYDTQQRYSEVRVISQVQDVADFFGTQANQVEGVAKDAGVPRFRPYEIVADQSADAVDGKTRARWEANTRAAKSEVLNVEVVDWRQGPGLSFPLWEVNSKVWVQIPEVGLNGEFLISSVRFMKDVNGGTVTNLGIERKDAYQPEPTVDPNSSLSSFFEDVGGE